MAITSGNIGAGVILFMSNNHYQSSVAIILSLLVISCFFKMPELHERVSIKPLTIKSLITNKTANLVWLFFGVAIGIRVFGMYIIMPQYLLKTLGSLPNWYGLTLVLYGIIVILTQIPVIGKKVSFSLISSITALGISCAIMCLPNLFFIESFIGALLWCFCLALEELFAPFIDFHAARSSSLLVKEISIGIGGGLCFLSSLTETPIEYLGVMSILCILLGSLFYKQTLNAQENKA